LAGKERAVMQPDGRFQFLTNTFIFIPLLIKSFAAETRIVEVAFIILGNKKLAI